MKFVTLFAIIAVLVTIAVALPPPEAEKDVVDVVNVLEEGPEDVKPQPRLSCQMLGPIGCFGHCKYLGKKSGYCNSADTCICFN